ASFLLMAKQRQQSRWRWARRLFRWFRIAVLLLILALLIIAIWLNQAGLPGFLKRQLVQQLRGHGMEVQFSRMRLRWYRGIVAENIQFGRHGETLGPQLSATEAELHLDTRALLHREVQVDSVVLRGGRLMVP